MEPSTLTANQRDVIAAQAAATAAATTNNRMEQNATGAFQTSEWIGSFRNSIKAKKRFFRIFLYGMLFLSVITTIVFIVKLVSCSKKLNNGSVPDQQSAMAKYNEEMAKYNEEMKAWSSSSSSNITDMPIEPEEPVDPAPTPSKCSSFNSGAIMATCWILTLIIYIVYYFNVLKTANCIKKADALPKIKQLGQLQICYQDYQTRLATEMAVGALAQVTGDVVAAEEGRNPFDQQGVYQRRTTFI